MTKAELIAELQDLLEIATQDCTSSISDMHDTVEIGKCLAYQKAIELAKKMEETK